MNNILVNDTNIFIDLHTIGLLKEMCDLPYEIHTVDFVIQEITEPKQHNAVQSLIQEGLIHVRQFTAEEMVAIAQEHSSVQGNLSFTDCSVCYYARKQALTLITGDKQLRNHATNHNVDVHGILFIIERLIRHAVISPKKGAQKLADLLSINPRLPKSEFEKKIEIWKNNK